MNNSTFHSGSTEEQTSGEIRPADDAASQFGAVDIVEAFTAMRHEWRGQTKESRALAEQIQVAVTNLQSLESKLLARAVDRSGEPTEARELVMQIVETDHQLSRAISAIALWESSRRRREEADANAAERYFAGMNAVARWFARPLLTYIAEQRAVQSQEAENAAIEGLNLVLARLRRAMHENGIERLDTVGQPFDADTMHAIGTVESADCPAGHVADQLSPAYRWQGRLLRFAEVRVAK